MSKQQEEKLVRCPLAKNGDKCNPRIYCSHRKKHKHNDCCNNEKDKIGGIDWKSSNSCPACIPVEPEPKKPCGKQSINELCSNCPDWYSVCELEEKKPEGEQEVKESMNIHSLAGTNVEFAFPNAGYPHDQEKAKKHLKLGGIYKVEKTAVGGWHTDVHLLGKPGIAFNSVMFAKVKQPEQEKCPRCKQMVEGGGMRSHNCIEPTKPSEKVEGVDVKEILKEFALFIEKSEHDYRKGDIIAEELHRKIGYKILEIESQLRQSIGREVIEKIEKECFPNKNDLCWVYWGWHSDIANSVIDYFKQKLEEELK